ncbi:MAG: porin family protein [Deltaproteobacteria bacterium]|nr:porin family protein [Deltaproteobacteria bacterium]
MMKKIIIGLLVCFCISFSVSAIAQPRYVGVNYLVADFESKKVETTADLDALSINFGQYLHKNFALEGRLGFGFGYDTYNDFSKLTSVDYHLNFLSGIYLRGELPLGKFRPYAMLGLSYVEVKVRGTVLGFRANGYDSDGDFSYGAGLDFQVNDSFGLNAEYMMLIDNSKRQIDSWSVGVKFYF